MRTVMQEDTFSLIDALVGGPDGVAVAGDVECEWCGCAIAGEICTSDNDEDICESCYTNCYEL